MKICMLTSSYPRFEGDFAGTFVQSLSHALAERGHEVHVLAAYDPLVQRSLPKSNVHLHYFGYAPTSNFHILGYARSLKGDVRLKRMSLTIVPSYVVSALAHLVRLHSRERFDIIHAHWMIPGGFIGALAARITRLPLVISLHGSDVYVGDMNPIFRLCGRWTLKSAQRVTSCSHELRKRAESIACQDIGIQVIPYGVDLKKFGSIIPERVSDLRRSLQLEENHNVVVALGRLVEKKGFEYLIESIPTVLESFPKTSFVIAGGGDGLSKLLALSQHLGVDSAIRFSGAVPWNEVATYLALGDIVAVPSVRDLGGNIDGLPNVLLEAMASARPIVASRVAGIPDVLRDGVDGLLVDEKSPKQLANAICSLFHSPEQRRTFAGNARERVIGELSWAVIASRFERTYMQVRQDAQVYLSDEPPVVPESYSRLYFLSECEGHAEFRETLGQTLLPRLEYAIQLSGLKKGMSVLDLGCGRGEVVRHCALVGAVAIGVDYSADAIELSKLALESLDSKDVSSTALLRADGKCLPFADSSFDRVFMLDIVEHLRERELAVVLAEVRRVLKRNGRLIIHTMPNLWYYRYGYPMFRLFERLRGKVLPEDPRDRWEFVRSVHVNEQDTFRLRTALDRAGFRSKVWLAAVDHPDDDKDSRTVAVLKGIVTRVFPLKLIFCNDIFALSSPLKANSLIVRETDAKTVPSGPSVRAEQNERDTH